MGLNGKIKIYWGLYINFIGMYIWVISSSVEPKTVNLVSAVRFCDSPP